MTMRELAAHARLIAESLAEHPWTKGVSERDRRTIDRNVESLNRLVGEIEAVERELCRRMAQLETENTQLKKESWEDGEVIRQLRSQLAGAN